jgi:hypothetical protein
MTATELAQRLDLTLNRTDDWDTQIGFRLIGETGAIRLFRRETGPEGGRPPWFEFYGPATQGRDRDQIAALYERAMEAVRSIDGRIDQDRVIDPRHSIELPRPTESR